MTVVRKDVNNDRRKTSGPRYLWRMITYCWFRFLRHYLRRSTIAAMDLLSAIHKRKTSI